MEEAWLMIEFWAHWHLNILASINILSLKFCTPYIKLFCSCFIYSREKILKYEFGKFVLYNSPYFSEEKTLFWWTIYYRELLRSLGYPSHREKTQIRLHFYLPGALEMECSHWFCHLVFFSLDWKAVKLDPGAMEQVRDFYLCCLMISYHWNLYICVIASSFCCRFSSFFSHFILVYRNETITLLLISVAFEHAL